MTNKKVIRPIVKGTKLRGSNIRKFLKRLLIYDLDTFNNIKRFKDLERCALELKSGITH